MVCRRLEYDHWIVLGLGLSLSFVGTAFSLVALGNGFSANVIFTILFGGLLVIYGLASFIPCLSLAVRRCRDTGYQDGVI